MSIRQQSNYFWQSLWFNSLSWQNVYVTSQSISVWKFSKSILDLSLPSLMPESEDSQTIHFVTTCLCGCNIIIWRGDVFSVLSRSFECVFQTAECLTVPERTYIVWYETCGTGENRNQEACGGTKTARTAVNIQRVRRALQQTRKLQLEETTSLIFASRLLIE